MAACPLSYDRGMERLQFILRTLFLYVVAFSLWAAWFRLLSSRTGKPDLLFTWSALVPIPVTVLMHRITRPSSASVALLLVALFGMLLFVEVAYCVLVFLWS